jgi:hypothetical protein
MEPLVKFIDEDLGLDGFSLLDLRAVDPPPAFGPDLVMMFGSARSERHLHVSADRLVRWLRGRGINASADGLLGKNELKVKLRRKARKAKLLGEAAAPYNADDGISTGWICVNLGTIGSSDVETVLTDDKGKTIGFGVQHKGTTIVVQMFVESRRQELELEKLWGGILSRSIARNSQSEDVKESHNTSDRRTSRAQAHPSGRRGFSTFRQQTVAASESPLIQALRSQTTSDNLVAIDSALSSSIESKAQVLQKLQEYLATCPLEQARLELRRGPDGRVCRLERLMERTLQNMTPQEAWGWRLWIKSEAAARGLGFASYDLSSLQKLVDSMQLSGVEVTREQFMSLIKIIFAKTGENQDITRQQAELSMQVVNAMFERGLEVLEHDVIATTIESLLQGGTRGPETERLLGNFECLLAQAHLPCPSESHLIQLLDGYASQGKWERFWEVWRLPPKFSTPRSAILYTYIFRLMATGKHQTRCIEALRLCVSDMEHENPPVPATDGLLLAIKECIRIADPMAEKTAQTLIVKDGNTRRLANQEFVKILRKLEPRTYV